MLVIKNYDVVEYGKEFSHIIYSISHETPFYDLKNIANTLNQEGITNAKILFDLLLSKGNSSQRFVMGEFENGNFVADAFRTLNIIKTHPIRKFSTNYLKSYPYLLERSVLNSEQKRMLINGIVI